MIYRITIVFALLLGLILLPAGTVSAQNTDTPTSNLPPGIAKKIAPLLEQLMERMHDMESMDHPPMHMEHLQALIDHLPPGILVQVLQAILQFGMPDMMQFHLAMQDGLLNQPPGQILNFARTLAR